MAGEQRRIADVAARGAWGYARASSTGRGVTATVRSTDRGGGGAVELRVDGVPSSVGNGPLGPQADNAVTPAQLLAASVASCTATTMELYARRKGWEIDEFEVDVDYAPAQRGSPTRCTIVVRLPEYLAPERRERLMQVGATSQIHRTLDGEIVFDERVELASAVKAARREQDPELRRRRIALLNGLRGAMRRTRE